MVAMAKFVFIAICSILIVGLSGCQETPDKDHQRPAVGGLLIKNATIVDGTSAAAFQGDIRIQGERITDVGALLQTTRDDRLIDATGLVVAPGFIDLHAHVLRTRGQLWFPERYFSVGGAQLLASFFQICQPSMACDLHGHS